MLPPLQIETRNGSLFILLHQVAGQPTKDTIFCRQCGKLQQAYRPAQLRQAYTAPSGVALRLFCSVCGWVYQRAPISARLRRVVTRRDNNECVYCGITGEQNGRLTLDHLVPESKGGATDADNLALCCGKCNSIKGNRSNVMVPRHGRFKNRGEK